MKHVSWFLVSFLFSNFAFASSERELAFSCTTTDGKAFAVYFDPTAPSQVEIEKGGELIVREQKASMSKEVSVLVEKDGFDEIYDIHRIYKVDFGSGKNLIVDSSAMRIIACGPVCTGDYPIELSPVAPSVVVLDKVSYTCRDAGTSNYTSLDRIINIR